MTVTLSFDIEEFDFPLERGHEIDFETQLSVSDEGVEKLLRLLDKQSVRATFYVTANYALHRKETVRRIVSLGYEVASHDFSHSKGLADPSKAKETLEGITLTKIAGYRSPRLTNVSSSELVAAGYLYNSSMNPTLLPGRYNNLNKPRTTFNEGSLTNYPMSVSYPLRIPLFWISLHVMNLRLYFFLAKGALKKDGHLNLYFHPWEFSNRLKEKQFGVPAYISRCSGDKFLAKLDNLITSLKNIGCCFTTTNEYLCSDE